MTTSRYTPALVRLHWLMAALVFATFALGVLVSQLPVSPAMFRLIAWHKWGGVLLFGLVLMRIFVRLRHGAPPLPGTTRRAALRAAHAVHGALYLCFLAVPLAGYFASLAKGFPVVLFGVLPLPAPIGADPMLAGRLALLHSTLAYAFGALVLLHVAAACKHQWLDRDGLISRMAFAPAPSSPKGQP
ncbi:cytochrome b [Crenobacter intestini]|uniref:Cytochrome b n=1 Tax=Crenobacter intestini TaxID=2563443 RepID=A0A4T0UWC3_9NEIS|nr:cytochrome b [Crenobacter intestini]TIC83141.1 cytochrome b [Crenobacter intestini]